LRRARSAETRSARQPEGPRQPVGRFVGSCGVEPPRSVGWPIRQAGPLRQRRGLSLGRGFGLGSEHRLGLGSGFWLGTQIGRSHPTRPLATPANWKLGPPRRPWNPQRWRLRCHCIGRRASLLDQDWADNVSTRLNRAHRPGRGVRPRLDVAFDKTLGTGRFHLGRYSVGLGSVRSSCAVNRAGAGSGSTAVSDSSFGEAGSGASSEVDASGGVRKHVWRHVLELAFDQSKLFGREIEPLSIEVVLYRPQTPICLARGLCA